MAGTSLPKTSRSVQRHIMDQQLGNLRASAVMVRAMRPR